MATPLSEFTTRLYETWLPSFCDAEHRQFDSQGFKPESLSKLSEYDAEWFLRAVDLGLVKESDGYFSAPMSKAKEQIFWEGHKSKIPRNITLWVEPVITVGAIARLNEQFGWPIERLGMQSSTWAFDLVGFGEDLKSEIIVCEVKKQPSEIRDLLRYMHLFCSVEPRKEEPTNGKEKNAYRKVQGIRNSWPQIFWALGPGNHSFVFKIERDPESATFALHEVTDGALKLAW